MDQPLADLDLEKRHGKVIQRRAGAKTKLLEGMKTPSSHVTDLLTSISNLTVITAGKYTKKAQSLKSLTTEIIGPFPCTSQIFPSGPSTQT